MKNSRIILSENFPFLVEKYSVYLNRRVFVSKWLPLETKYAQRTTRFYVASSYATMYSARLHTPQSTNQAVFDFQSK